MPEVPKIVHERLRKGQWGGEAGSWAGMPAPHGSSPHGSSAHPDVDVLAAFTEQALLPAEREQVLGHLAMCEDCRAAVLIALPPVESAAATQVAAESAVTAGSPKRSWSFGPAFAWPTLRWAALAAGVIVAGAVMLYYSGNSNPSEALKQSSEPKVQVAQAPAPAAGGTNAVSAERDKTLADQKTAEIATKLEPKVSAKTQAVMKAKDAESRSDTVANKRMSSGAPPARNATAAGLMSGKPAAPAAPAARETVEVSGMAAAPTVQTENSALGDRLSSSTSDMPVSGRNAATSMARNEAAPPITKAKPAMAAQQTAPMQMARAAAQSGALAKKFDAPQEAQWSLYAGMLRRSTDGGSTWETALPDGHLLCYAPHGNDVWAGGKSGLLYHSVDNGATWIQLHPVIGDKALASDITHIEASSAMAIVLTTSNGETWSSSDNGKSWASK
jgi:hypothetical protein